MKLSVLALDYDGTSAHNDIMGPLVREAIRGVRAQGVKVLLATGRTLDELRRVAGDLRFIDGVVAENGAVLHFPDSNHTSALAPSVPGRYLNELRRRGVPHRSGECLVDTDANEAPALLNLIRALELPLVLAFNSGRVMTLPQGVSKATGVRSMLDALRLSAHNMVAIGDAENDHELLRVAEVGAAVEWGSAALRAVADTVVPGSGPPGVAEYIRAIAADGRIPVPARGRRRLRLGFTEDGRDFSLAVRGRNVLVAGDAKSGKSWVAGLLCEQLILHGYCVCVIDPEGDYRSLEGLPGVTVLGGDDLLPSHRELLRALRYPDRSVVIDLSKKRHEEKVEWVRAALPVLNEMRRHSGLPHRILIDEAHYFLEDATAHRLIDPEANGYTLVTYRVCRIPQEVLATTEVAIVTKASNPSEIDALRRLCVKCYDIDPTKWTVLNRLAPSQAVALPLTEESGGALVQFTLGSRLTPHVRHREKYIDAPVGEGRAFVFNGGHELKPRAARTLRQFVAELGSRHDLDSYLRRSDFSRWIADVFGDHPLAAELANLEAEHRASSAPGTVPAIFEAIRTRYDVGA